MIGAEAFSGKGDRVPHTASMAWEWL